MKAKINELQENNCTISHGGYVTDMQYTRNYAEFLSSAISRDFGVLGEAVTVRKYRMVPEVKQ